MSVSMVPERVDPVTPQEWQQAVDAADFCLRLDKARVFGLVKDGIEVDVDRCQQILAFGEDLGFRAVNHAV